MQQVRRSIRNDEIVLQLAAAFAILATAAGDARAVRRDGAQRDAADTRDRHPDRAGRAGGADPGMVLREMSWILGIGLVGECRRHLRCARYTRKPVVSG